MRAGQNNHAGKKVLLFASTESISPQNLWVPKTTTSLERVRVRVGGTSSLDFTYLLDGGISSKNSRNDREPRQQLHLALGDVL